MPMSISDPPRARNRSTGDIHDGIAQRKENSSGERFREEISQIVSRTNERHCELVRLDGLTNEKMSPLDVLSPSVMLGIVREITRRLVVGTKG